MEDKKISIKLTNDEWITAISSIQSTLNHILNDDNKNDTLIIELKDVLCKMKQQYFENL